jgi:polar amino acid transport system substrate-binding protein
MKYYSICLISFLISACSHTSHTNTKTNNTYNDTQPEKVVVKLRANEWMPYNGSNIEKPGYLIEIAQYAFEKHGYELDYQVLPWDESLQQTQKGLADCLVGAFKKDTPNFIHSENAFGVEEIIFYGRADARAWEFKDLDSFKGIRIGIVSGKTYGPLLDFYISNSNHDIYRAKGSDTFQENIERLFKKDIDILLESSTIFNYHALSNASLIHIKELDRRKQNEGIYFACSPAKKSSQHYIEILDQGLIELRMSGKLKEILAKYGLKDWE